MLASVAEQYMIAKSFENPMTMDENIRFLPVGGINLAHT